MGKLKRTRRQFHSKPINTGKKDKIKTEHNEDVKANMKVNSDSASLKDNIFQSLKIDSQFLAQTLPDFDARTTVTNKSLRGLNLKKKEKRKLKHDFFMERIDAIQAAKRKAKEKKKREKTPIVGDMSVMEEALPTLELLLKEGNKTDKNIPTKVRGVQKEKKRKKQMLSDMTIFKQVLEHPAFKDNPTATITEHLQNKLQQEEEMDE